MRTWRGNLAVYFYRARLSFHACWLVMIPVSLWAIATVYVPIFAADLSPAETWTLALLIFVLAGGSLLGHFYAHVISAHLLGIAIPECTPLMVWGDASQVWSVAGANQIEGLAAMAGPGFNFLLAAATYSLWNAQLNPILNLCALFLFFFTPQPRLSCSSSR